LSAPSLEGARTSSLASAWGSTDETLVCTPRR
jgi:hypothetical protein